MFVTPAYAQAAGGIGGAFGSFIPLILIFGIMYFLLIRPQQKKLKDHKSMVEAVRRGDQVITAGGGDRNVAINWAAIIVETSAAVVAVGTTAHFECQVISRAAPWWSRSD